MIVQALHLALVALWACVPQELCTCSLRMALEHSALDPEAQVSVAAAGAGVASMAGWCAIRPRAARASRKKGMGLGESVQSRGACRTNTAHVAPCACIFPQDVKLALLHDVASALAYLHGRAIVHGGALRLGSASTRREGGSSGGWWLVRTTRRP